MVYALLVRCFSREMTFGDINNIHVIANNLINVGEDDDGSFLEVLAWEKNVRFRPGKIQYKVSDVMYIGHIISAAGLRPHPAIVKTAIPSITVPVGNDEVPDAIQT